MKKTPSLFTLFLLFLPVIGLSQTKPGDLFPVDSFACTVKYKNNLVNLTKELTDRYPEQLYKTRAIFKWITENIGYDYKFYNKYNYKGKDPKTYHCRNDRDCEARKIAWEIKYIDKILRKKKAVCMGYAMLFKKMCDLAGLQAEYITGYIRTKYYQVGTAGTLDHAWNAVWIDSAYYLLDATWAAGGCPQDEDGKLLSFKKNFNNYYWLTPAADFARNHFPQNNKWVLQPNYTKEHFATNPYYDASVIDNIKLVSPASGVITAKKGDTIRFKIDYTRYFRDLQINSNLFRNPDIYVWDQISRRKKVRRLDNLAIEKQQYIKYNRNGSLYEFQYVVTDNSLYYLDILFDRQRIMRFKVISTQP